MAPPPRLRASLLPAALQRLHPINWPIATKLSLTLLLVTLLPMGLTAYVNLRSSLRQLTKTEHRNLELLATITARQMDQLILDTRRVTLLLANDRRAATFLAAPAPGAPPEELQRLLQQVIQSNPDYEAVSLMDRTGRCLASTAPERLGQNYGNREYFQQALQGTLHVSDVQVGTTSGRAGLYFSAPVRDRAQRIVGVLLLKITGQTLADVVNELRVGTDGYAFVADNTGVIIIHRDPRLLYHSLAPLPETLQQRFANRFTAAGIDRIPSLNLPDLSRAIAAASQSGHTSYQLPDQPNRLIVGYAPLTQKQWVVAVNEPELSFTAPLRLLAQQVGLSVFLVGGGVVLVALLLARSITAPVRSLTQVARSLEQGHLDLPPLPVTRQDEIGVLAQAFNTMTAGLRERQRERDMFGRVVSPEVREKLLSGDLALGGENRRVTVLFSDIRGFSTLAEHLAPETVVTLLNEYLTEMTQAIRPWGGYVNNFIGDAIVVIFGAPVDQTQTERRAVAAAMSMRAALEDLNQRRLVRGDLPLSSGIGISTGEAIAGQVGSLDRLLYTVIGDSVNIAARLETLTKSYPDHPILMNESTAIALQNDPDFSLLYLGPMVVKGRIKPVEVYTIKDGPVPLPPTLPDGHSCLNL